MLYIYIYTNQVISNINKNKQDTTQSLKLHLMRLVGLHSDEMSEMCGEQQKQQQQQTPNGKFDIRARERDTIRPEPERQPKTRKHNLISTLQTKEGESRKKRHASGRLQTKRANSTKIVHHISEFLKAHNLCMNMNIFARAEYIFASSTRFSSYYYCKNTHTHTHTHSLAHWLT